MVILREVSRIVLWNVECGRWDVFVSLLDTRFGIRGAEYGI